MDDEMVRTIDTLRGEIHELRKENAGWREENRRLRKRTERLERENRQLRDRLEAAERAAACQAAPFRRSDRLKVPPECHKRAGRQAGHAGHCRGTVADR